MSDFKSKLPDLKEVAEIGGKLFNDLKTSISEIIDTYKKKHAEAAPSKDKKAKEAAKDKKEAE